MFTAHTDGTNVMPVTDEMISPEWMDFAPDDSFLAITAGDALLGRHLYVADLRTPGDLQQIDFGGQIDTASVPSFLGPTGDEIVFRGSTVSKAGIRYGVFAARPDGTGLRALTPTDGVINGQMYEFPQPSPDGQYLAYSGYDPDHGVLRIHVVDLRTGEDKTLTPLGGDEGFALFAPDSRRILFISFGADHQQLVAMPIDGSGPRIPIGPSHPWADGDFLSGTFSPDGKWVIVTNTATKETRIVDATTGGDREVLPWAAADISGWQRLAP